MWRRRSLLAALLLPAAVAGASRADDSIFTAVADPPGERPADPEAGLSLREAVLLALRNNLDIELARIEPAIASEGVDAARGAYDPILQGNFTFDHPESLTANTLQATGGGAQLNLSAADRWDYGLGVAGILPFGLQYSSTSDFNRFDSNQIVVLLDKQYTSSWVSRVTLPLMRDLGMNDASVTVRRSEITSDMSEEQFRGALTGIVASVEDLYWSLAASQAAVGVARKSLATAQDLLEQSRIQAEIGIVAGIAIVQAEAGVAEREVALIQAENRAVTARDQLLDALLAPSADVFEEREVVPEPPRFQEYEVDLQRAIREALRTRPELVRARQAVEMADVEADFAQNQARPRFDLVASYGVSGLSGPSKGDPITVRDPSMPGATLTGVFPDQGDGADSFDDFFRGDGAKSYSFGVRLEMPLGNDTGRSRSVQRRIEARRAQLLLKKQEQVVIREVREAVRTLRAAARAVSAAQRRRSAAEESLRAERERLRLGDSTPFLVLQFDEDLAEAEQQVIGALQAYENAITATERVRGTLLQRRGIRIEQELSR